MENKVENKQLSRNDGNTLLAAGFPSSEQPVAVNKVSVEYTLVLCEGGAFNH
jgi:hypothetical protein